jgi:uncharacterized protein YyaL (SSP411 family)
MVRSYTFVMALVIVALLLVSCEDKAAIPSAPADVNLWPLDGGTVTPNPTATTEVLTPRPGQGESVEFEADAPSPTKEEPGTEQSMAQDVVGSEPTRAGEAARPSLNQAEGVDWYEWGPETFARAKTENKLILLDLTAVWCHWCHVMDETTYTDPAVIKAINELYIPVRVDTDLRPDVQARYLGNGWPTTAFLTPEGEVLTSFTYVPPEQMRSLLPQVSDYFVANEPDITARLAELRQKRADARLQAVSGIHVKAVQIALNRLEADYDPTYGGFGQEPKFPVPGAIALILRHNHTAGDAEWYERVAHTLAGMQNLIDPVWGGLYRYSVTADWQTPHYEKMLFGNAKALRDYLEAYRATGDVVYRAAAEAILSYVERFLWDPAGGFFGSQDADLVQPGGHAILMEGEAYFTLPEEERLALGVPYVDESFYSNWNGQMVVAMLEAAVVLEEPHFQEMALLTLERLWTEARGPDGQIWHSLRLSDDGSGERVALPPATLSDQTHIGLALLAAYSATGQRQYMSQAVELADYVLTELRDAELGGFFDLAEEAIKTGAVGLREISCQDNIAVSRFMTRLYRFTELKEYTEAAEGALRVCAAAMTDNPEFALAVDDLLHYPLTLAVVGTPSESATDALLVAANRFYAPGKVVIPLDPALGPPAVGSFTYPEDRTAIYACIEERCTLPIEDPGELADAVTWLLSAEEQ